jgi:hypothetical protein
MPHPGFRLVSRRLGSDPISSTARQPPIGLNLNFASDQLDQARRARLADLSHEHRAVGSAATALALARAEWMCGEYDDAIHHFREVRTLAPDSPEAHLSLVRAASALGMAEEESQALRVALDLHPAFPELVLHAALREVPGNIPLARRWLGEVLAHPACAQFDFALAVIESGQPMPDTPPGLDSRRAAQLQSLRWATAHTRSPQMHVGLPTAVLGRALDMATLHGLTLECGVYFGRSLRLMAARTAGTVHGFDSFQGLPEAWSAHEGPGAYSTAGRLPRIAGDVSLHAGWFEDTLPVFFASHPGPIRLLHIDCDLYSSTRTVLEYADERLVPGSLVVFDDFVGYPGCEQHELRAFMEFAASRNAGWELVAACLMGREVAVRITSR